MKPDKKKELTDEELKKAVGGRQITRKRIETPPEPEEPEGPTPTIGEATPLPDPDFGTTPPPWRM